MPFSFWNNSRDPAVCFQPGSLCFWWFTYMRSVHFVILSNVLLKTSSRKEEWICRSLAREVTWTGKGGRTFSFISTSPGTSPGLKHDLKSECWAVINTWDTTNWDMIAEETEIHSKREWLLCIYEQKRPQSGIVGVHLLCSKAQKSAAVPGVSQSFFTHVSFYLRNQRQAVALGNSGLYPNRAWWLKYTLVAQNTKVVR